MAAIVSLLTALWTRIVIYVAGFFALLKLIWIGITGVTGLGGSLRTQLTSPDGFRTAFRFMRAFLPNLGLSAKVITSYENKGTVIVTRFDDVKDVLRRDDDFEAVYGPRMIEITAGRNFFLGMRDTPEYTRDVSNMRLAVRRNDLPVIVLPFVAGRAAELVRASKGRIDVPQDLTLRVPAQLMDLYFGTPGPSEKDMIAWTTIMFWYLFIDLNADPGIGAAALDGAAKCRAYLDAAIAERKRNPTTRDDILNRCLEMQKGGMPGMDDLSIRNNIIGLLIGAVPTTSKACIHALDQLLSRPEALAAAQNCARENDDALLAAHVFEALRFNPVNPMIYRRALRDTAIAPSTMRSVQVQKDTMVLAANLSAMFDRLRVKDPENFHADRPWTDYILWGDGLHTCFGAHINQVMIPQVLKPLLQQEGLRRAAGTPGKVDNGGTPFPVHLWLEFKPAE